MMIVNVKKVEERYAGVETGIAPGGWCCHCWCHCIGPVMSQDEEEILS